MDTKKIFKKLLDTINFWESELQQFEFKDLLKKADNDSWSLGQVYMHLIGGTLNFHLKQVEICLNSNENKSEKKNFKGFVVYSILHSFPPIKIKVPASDAYTPLQPTSKDQISDGLNKVKKEMEILLDLLQSNNQHGKTKHPGFSYLNAKEWYKLIEMHFRHHLKQKKDLDQFLYNT